ncbi:HD domain-containing protein [Candidatus Peregrinibacteria bacterium]|nr:HD domain-containing protein [Candidatus Peregrinibacteria bacterium]
MMQSAHSVMKKIEQYAQARQMNLEKVKLACKWAVRLHDGQKRKSGDPFVIHPLMVAYYASRLNADEDSIIASILHDTVEDTSVTLKEIEETFGKEIAMLIDGLTKLSKEKFQNEKTLDSRIETIRKWFLALQKDVRIAVIRLVDRLHNMETLFAHEKPEKRKRISKQTMDVYAKIAEKLCIHDLSNDLGSLAVQYYDPECFENIRKLCNGYNQDAQKILKELKSELHDRDQQKKIDHIEYESPSVLAMHELHVCEAPEISINMPLSFSIITKTKEDCYGLLYLIHSMYRPAPNKVKDYITNPAANGYHGLHTEVILKDGRHMKLKIRTHEMQDYYRYGITLSCFSKNKEKMMEFDWLKSIEHVTKESTSEAFFDQLSHDILSSSIVVHTDQNRDLILPANSTGLDAAFYGFGSKALRLKKIKINGVVMPIFRHLHHNDTIYFECAREFQLKYEWLEYVDTALGASFVRSGLQKINEEKRIDQGKKILMDVLKHHGKGFIEEIRQKELQIFFDKCHIANINDMYKMIASGNLDPEQIVAMIDHSDQKNGMEKSREMVLKIDLAMESEEPKIFEILKILNIKIKKYQFLITKNKKRVQALVLLKEKQQKMLEHYLKKQIQTNSIQLVFKYEKYSIALMVVCILIFWGLEPVLASYIYSKTSIQPLELIFIRFWVILIPMLPWMIFNFFNRKNTLVPIGNPYLILSSFFLIGMLFFRYKGLQITTPSSYSVLHRDHVLISSLFTIPIAAFFKRKNITMILVAIIIFSNALILGLIPNWSLQGKFFSILATIFFSFFTLQSNMFLRKYEVKSRYYQFITIIYFYCALIITIFAPMPFDRIFFLMKSQALPIIFLSVSVFVPYILWHHLILKYEEQNYTRISFALTWIATVVAEYFLLGNSINPIIILAGTGMSVAIYLMTRIQKEEVSANKREIMGNED